MSTREERARRYRTKAEECISLSRLATAFDVRDQYRHVAECYESLATAEERLEAASAQWASGFGEADHTVPEGSHSAAQ
jgi:hypothetical protein